jgi:hypothetical protein
MGADPWICVVPYQIDVRNALAELQDRLRNQSMECGMPELGLSNIGCNCREVLKIKGVAEVCTPGCVSPLPSDILIDSFGSDAPSRTQVASHLEFFEELERGDNIYLIAFDMGEPTQIIFAGYSLD